MKLKNFNVSEYYIKMIEKTEFREGLILLVFVILGGFLFIMHYASIIVGVGNKTFTVFSLLGLLFLIIAILGSQFYKKIA